MSDDGLHLILPRSEAAELEIKLHEVKTRSMICMRQIRTAASNEMAKLTSKIDVIADELVKLEASDGALRQTVADLLESMRQLEAQIEHQTVPKEDWHRANQEIAALQDQLRDGLHTKTAEIRKLHGAMQVWPALRCYHCSCMLDHPSILKLRVGCWMCRKVGGVESR